MRHANKTLVRDSSSAGELVHITDPDTGKVYPIPAGGSDDDGGGTSDAAGAADDAAAPEGDPGEDAEPLGEPGLRALQAERDARKEAEKARREDREALERAQAELEQIREANKTAEEKAIDEARQQARLDGRNHAIRDFAPTLASMISNTSDPTLAVLALGDLTRFVTEDGSVDTDAMSVALDEAIEKHPSLAKEAATATGAGAAGGARPPAGDAAPKNLREALEAKVARSRT